MGRVKGVIAAIIIVLGLAGLVMAATYTSTENVLNKVYTDIIGATITHRSAIITTDTVGWGGVGGIISADLSGYKYVIVETQLSGTTPTCRIFPTFGNRTLSKYFLGNPVNLSAQTNRFVLEVDGCTNFLISADSFLGASPSLNIYLTPFN